MLNFHPKLSGLILAGGAVFAALALSIDQGGVSGSFGLVSTAMAAEAGGGGKSGGEGQRNKGGSAEKGKGGASAGGKGSALDKKVLRAPSAVDEDSDRPVWAGVKGGKSGGGGKPFGAGTKKGDLYGDMYILLRDANGVPVMVDGLEQVVAFVYDATGALVPLVDAEGRIVTIPYTADGDLATTVVIGTTTYDVFPGEIELGRLSVGRSPSKVLDHALTEALTKLTSGTVTLDASGRLVVDGVTIDSPLENLALYDRYMTTATLPGVTLPEGFDPASLLAAAADKTGAITVDTVVYMNSILGINTGTTYYDFSTYDYDRTATWSNVTVTVLVQQADGSYVPTPVNVYDTLFGSTAWTDPTPTGGADDFAAAANDYLQVIEFVHDNEVR